MGRILFLRWKLHFFFFSESFALFSCKSLFSNRPGLIGSLTQLPWGTWLCSSAGVTQGSHAVPGCGVKLHLGRLLLTFTLVCPPIHTDCGVSHSFIQRLCLGAVSEGHTCSLSSSSVRSCCGGCLGVTSLVGPEPCSVSTPMEKSEERTCF